MSEKYIRENRKSFNIVKSSKIYAKATHLDEAIFVRDLLIQNDWDLNRIPQIVKKDDNYLVLAVFDEKLHLICKYKIRPNDITIRKHIKRFKRNPNNSKYGLNITRVFDTLVIKKQIAGDDYIFGYYDNLEDAQFVRNFLLDNQWDVNKFNRVEYDDETHTYKLVSVIDDMVYVIDTFLSKNNIDFEKSYEKFLSKISKHKYGLSNYPPLDLLKDRIAELEEKFQVRTKDDVWSFNGINEDESILSQVIFNLTPFQKSVYDAIDSDTSLEEIERSLIRYKSKNFTQKILKNIDELRQRELIEKTGDDTFSKTNL